jgi:hypothetical protein
MINHPTTPLIAQISMVRRVIGIGGETTRFVTNKSIRPTMALTASPISSAVVRANKTNTATTAHSYPIMVTPTEAGSYYYARCLSCLTSGPKRSSSWVAYRALKEEVDRLHQGSGSPPTLASK